MCFSMLVISTAKIKSTDTLLLVKGLCVVALGAFKASAVAPFTVVSWDVHVRKVGLPDNRTPRTVGIP